MRRTPLTALAVAGLTLLLTGCCDAYPTLKQAPVKGPGLELPAPDGSGGDLGACVEGDTCDDGDPCTENRCVEGACVALPIATGECCASDVGGACPELPSCTVDADCDDGDACTVSACSADGCVSGDLCGPEDPTLEPCAGDDAPEGCCTSDADCDDGDPATVNTCEGATCVVTLNPDACVADADCDDGEACTTDRCVGGLCEHEGGTGAQCCVPGDAIIATFDTGKLQGIYVTDNLETGVFWTPDKTRATSGNYSLYMGDPVTQTYAIGQRVKSSATTPVLTLPAGGATTLAFDLYKVTRQTKNFDVLQVFVLRDGALLPAWTSKSLPNGVTGERFERVEVSLEAWAGQTLQLRFVFDSVDAATAPLEGAYLDGLTLETRCE